MTKTRFNPKDYYNIQLLLESPYKWGHGWTQSNELYEEFEKQCISIISSMGLQLCEKTISDESLSAANEFGEYIYFHPMELNGTLRKKEAQKFISYVLKHISPLPSFSIGIIKLNEIKTNLLSYESGYSNNPNVRYEEYYLKKCL